MIVNASVANIDFQTMPFCDTEIIRDSVFTIENSEATMFFCVQARLFAAFLLNLFLRRTMCTLPGGRQQVVVRLRANYAGQFATQLTLPY
jgi:hypothetical protein